MSTNDGQVPRGTLRLTRPIRADRRVEWTTQGEWIALCHKWARWARTARYVERAGLVGYRLYPLGQPWVGGIE